MTRSTRPQIIAAALVVAALVTNAKVARSDDATPGFPEPVIQWDVQKGETCEDIAKALYGDAHQAHLVMRYNRVACTRGAPLKAGQTLVMPAKVTTVPSAVLTSLVPSVRAKAAGASWGEAAPGMPLSTNANVNTMDKASASIHFIDRTKVFLSENTLVVIFGTASQSAVSKAIPPSVEVDSGEIRAALSALRGDPAEVSVPGGGRVSAASHDTVVERKGERTTVSVFDGLAHVLNAGKSVEVPKNFGTRFVGQKPPIPPRPLPAAPTWDKAPKSILFASAHKADLDASWKAVDKAKAYRVEVATDASFDALITREEVPEDTRAFHAAGLPPGNYFLRVRAIDKEDFLGIATATVSVAVVEPLASRGGATISGDELVVSPYASLAIEAPSGTQISVDDGPFVANPPKIDVTATRPSRLTVRVDKNDTALRIRYRMPKVEIVGKRTAGDVAAIRVELSAIEDELVDAVKPFASVHRRGALVAERVELARADGQRATFTATLPRAGEIDRVDVLDGFGTLLASRGAFDDANAKDTTQPAVIRKAQLPRIGIVAQGFGPNPFVADWWAPTAPNAASVGFAFEHGFAKGRTNGQGRAQVSGQIGPVGLEGSLFTDDLDSPTESHETAWLGARVRVLRLKDAALEIAPIGRIGVGRGSQTVLGSAGVALGGARGRFSWLGDVAFQFRPEAYPYIPSFVGGMTVDALSWLRPFATVDAFGAKIADKARGGGGLTVGAEAGHLLFGTIALRVSPFAAPLGGVTGTLSIGVRQEP